MATKINEEDEENCSLSSEKSGVKSPVSVSKPRSGEFSSFETEPKEKPEQIISCIISDKEEAAEKTDPYVNMAPKDI